MHRLASSLRRTLSPALASALLGLMASLGLVSTEAAAQGAPADQGVIEYRQLLMGSIGSNMGAIGSIMKHQLDRPGAIASHAQQMADSAKLIAPAFEQRVTAGKTDAKPEIWKDWAKFEQAIADFEKAAANLAGTAKGTDPAATGAAVKALGESCSGCHDSFRKPKEQSYKNR